MGRERKPNGYWTEEVISKTLIEITKKLGHCPTHTELREMGENTLGYMISKYYRNINYFRKKLNLQKKNDPRLIYTEEYILKEVEKIIKKIGKFPSQKWMRKNGCQGLSFGIDRHFGGFNKLRKELGYELNINPIGYWNKWKNVKREINIIIKKVGSFPNCSEARAINPAVSRGIRAFGGIHEVAKRMGYKPPYGMEALDGHFVRSSYEYFLDNFLYKNNIKHSIDRIIKKGKTTKRYDFKIGEIFIEIWGYSDYKSGRRKIYNQRKRIKEKFYKDNGIKLVSFYEEELRCKNEKKLNILFRERLSSVGII